jgi:hypothetical protein
MMMSKPQIVKQNPAGRPPKGGFARGVEIAAQREQVGVIPIEKVLVNLLGLADSSLSHALFIYLTECVAKHPQAAEIMADFSRTIRGADPVAWKFCQTAMKEYGT